MLASELLAIEYDDEREAIIQDILSSRMIADVGITYEMVAEIVDEVFREPAPELTTES